MEKKYHYTYQIINLNSYMKYIGVRSCNCKPIKDIKYLGSSKSLSKAIKKEGKEWFKKEILGVWKNRKEALSHEIKLHSINEVGINPMFYNKVKQIDTGFDSYGTCLSEEHKQKISKSNKGKKRTEEYKQNLRKPRKCIQGENHPRFNTHLPKDYKQKISKSLKETYKNIIHPRKGKTHTEESRKKMKGKRENIQGENHPRGMLNKHHKQKTKKKISDATKGHKNGFYGKIHTEESRKKISESRKGKKWINKNGKNKIIDLNDFKKYENLGWKIGRHFNGKS